MILSGADILLESLHKEKVDVIFGFPGGQILPVYDALYKFERIKHILTRHEQAAAHAADGYARATGKVGVCLATSGPGATNLITGIATAYMDSIPMVAITGQVPTSMLGNDSFQEADIFGITRPITKYNYLVKKVEDLASIVKEAFYLARSGRPGPVLIDLPKDIQVAKTEFIYPDHVDLPSYRPTYKGNPKQIESVAKAIDESKKPVIYAGGGVIISGANKELAKFAEKISAPVTTTLMAMGAFSGNHPLNMGMLGMHGTYMANHAVTNCDLLIALGARFDDRVTGDVKKFALHAKIIHIDIDPAEIGKRVRVDIPVVGDVKTILNELIEKVSHRGKNEWNETVEKWGREHPLRYTQKEKGVLKPQYVVEKLYEITKGENIVITTEVGQNQMWAAQFFKYIYPRSFASSGGLGTMGYGFPAAIGAQVGCPEKIVVDIAGDGSIQMNIQELATVVQYNIPVKIFILNNCFLGMVRQWQELFYERRYSQTCLASNPDFVAIAKAYGAEGIKVTKPEEVEAAIKEALYNGKPTLVDFHVAQEENVSPMVPAGAPLNEIIELA